MMVALRVSVVVFALALAAPASASPATVSISIRNHPQTLYLYGTRGGAPVVVSSGDGGWMHLAPHVADLLASRGFFVVGFDVKAYLASFTSDAEMLRSGDVPGDYAVLEQFAAQGAHHRVMLIGVSEGGGLSVLAAASPQTRAFTAGVIGLGLPDINELAWRWQDSVTYLTHAVPNEPTFSTSAIAARVAPLPLAAIQSATDDYVPLSEAQNVIAHAAEPKRLWVINARDHSFSDHLPDLDARLLEAARWVVQHTPS